MPYWRPDRFPKNRHRFQTAPKHGRYPYCIRHVPICRKEDCKPQFQTAPRQKERPALYNPPEQSLFCRLNHYKLRCGGPYPPWEAEFPRLRCALDETVLSSKGAKCRCLFPNPARADFFSPWQNALKAQHPSQSEKRPGAAKYTIRKDLIHPTVRWGR